MQNSLWRKRERRIHKPKLSSFGHRPVMFAFCLAEDGHLYRPRPMWANTQITNNIQGRTVLSLQLLGPRAFVMKVMKKV